MTLRSIARLIPLTAACLAAPSLVAAQSTPVPQTAPAKDPVISATEPAGAVALPEALKAKPGQKVTVCARVATGEGVFDPAHPAMKIVDSDAGAAAATVRVLGADGQPQPATLAGRGGLAPALEVIITGTLAEPAAGPEKPAVINADSIYPVPTGLPAGFVLATAPKDTRTVEEAKKDAKKGDTVAVRGRIGGGDEPFVSGRAVFTIVGPGLKSCADNPDDHCKTPWDYCCETAKDIALHSATVQLVDAAGKPMKLDVKGKAGLRELSDVTVVGKALAADGKTLVVQATGLYVNKR